MFTTLYMGLAAWDQNGDPYDHSQLANNFIAIAGHRHVPGEGRRIPTDGLEDLSVTTSKIASNAVTPNKIPDFSLTEVELADNSVSRRTIQDEAVGTAELGDESVTFAKLDPSVVPIGSVIMWYRPNGSVGLPVGWEVCDGRPWSTVPNAWGLASGTMPDFRNRVPLGAALSGVGSGPNDPPDIGQIGGAFTVDLTHGHTVNSHTHVTPNHVHGQNAHAHGIGTDGSHGHTVAGGRTINVVNHGRFDGDYNFADQFSNFHRSEFSLAYVAGWDGPGAAGIDAAGSHSHGGATAAAGGDNTLGSGSLTTTATSPGTNSALGVTTVKPRYVGVLFLMRVL